MKNRRNKVVTFLLGLRPAFYLQLIALVFLCVGYANYFHTMTAFDYPADRWIMLLSIAAIVLIAFQMVNGVVAGNQTGTVFVLAAGVVFIALVVCFYLSSCIANIAIYFSVGGMGNVEANAVGVPSCIRGIVLLVISIVSTIASAFFPSVKEDCSLLDVLFGTDKREERV